MNFARNYPKLWEPKFSTLRRYNKWSEKAFVPVKVFRKYIYHAFVQHRQRLTLADIPLTILLKDTNTESRKCALQLINSFYQIPIDPIREKLNLYWMIPCYNTFKHEKYTEKFKTAISDNFNLVELKVVKIL